MNKEKIIQDLLAQGKSKEEIYRQLLEQGWRIDDIESSFPLKEKIKTKEDLHKRTIFIIVTIGAILIGAGIFSFIAANWQAISAFIKVTIILFAMLIFYILGWYSKEKLNFKKTGEALMLLGGITYGGGIFLSAQIFHIRANWPDGFILWMLGLIIMAFVIETYTQLYLAILLGIIALSGYLVVLADPFIADPFIFTSSILIVITTVMTFVAGLKIRKKIPIQERNYY